MATFIKLSKITKVDLRDCWQNEATDFTPWLAYYKTLQEYKERYGYGKFTDTVINGKCYKVLPLAHPRQIGGLGSHSSNWYDEHQKWENNR